MRICVTGKIGAGKTTASELLSRATGYKVIDVDAIGHGLLSDPKVQSKVLSEFGMDVLDDNMQIDRKKLSSAVFADKSKLERLNLIMHPYIIRILSERVTDKVIIDAALFNELKLSVHSDLTILIKAGQDVVFDRLKDRYSKSQIMNINDMQSLPLDFDYIIENNGTLDELREKVLNITKEIYQTGKDESQVF